jgi:hypothetical protein
MCSGASRPSRGPPPKPPPRQPPRPTRRGRLRRWRRRRGPWRGRRGRRPRRRGPAPSRRARRERLAADAASPARPAWPRHRARHRAGWPPPPRPAGAPPSCAGLHRGRARARPAGATARPLAPRIPPGGTGGPTFPPEPTLSAEPRSARWQGWPAGGFSAGHLRSPCQKEGAEGLRSSSAPGGEEQCPLPYAGPARCSVPERCRPAARHRPPGPGWPPPPRPAGAPPMPASPPSGQVLARGHTRPTRGTYADHLTRLREGAPCSAPALDRAAVESLHLPTHADPRGTAAPGGLGAAPP